MIALTEQDIKDAEFHIILRMKAGNISRIFDPGVLLCGLVMTASAFSLIRQGIYEGYVETAIIDQIRLGAELLLSGWVPDPRLTWYREEVVENFESGYGPLHYINECLLSLALDPSANLKVKIPGDELGISAGVDTVLQ